MKLIDKVKKRCLMVFCYLISLLPVFLPWCYFDEGIDGIKYGTDIVHGNVFMILVAVTVLSMALAKGQRGHMAVKLLLLMHFAIYLFGSFFWYVPLLTDFNLLLSLDAMHYGCYLSLLSIALMFLLYVKSEKMRRAWQ